jgi:hypothetical protein
MLSPSSYTFACINLVTYTLYNFRMGFMVSIELLTPTFICCHTSLPSYMVLRFACDFVRVFGLPSIMM